MKQKLKRFMASFMAMLTVFTTLLSNGILECVSV